MLPIKDKAIKHPPKEYNLFLSEKYINYLFSENAYQIIGPTFQGYYDAIEANERTTQNINKIRFKDHLHEI